MRRAAAARKQRPGPWIYCRGLLLRLPGRVAASPSGDSDQPARDEEWTTTPRTRSLPTRPWCPFSSIHSFSVPFPIEFFCFDSDQQELSVSPVPWTVTTGTPPSSSIVRSSAPTTMIPHRTRYDCIVGYLVVPITINMTYA
ncbi:hypothetical protein VPH35_106564 [Triticum aestivum]